MSIVSLENTKLAAGEGRDSTLENKPGRRPRSFSTDDQELLDRYAAHFKLSPLLGASLRTYVSAVRGFLAWLAGGSADGDPLSEPAARDWAVRDYRSYLVTVTKRAPATVNKVMAALDDFYIWRGLGRAEAKRQEIPQRAPKALDPREAKRYLRAVEAWPRVRDRAIALVPLYAGARIAEVAALDTGDVRISARKGELHLVGKGEKSRTVPLHPKLREALGAWILERPMTESPALFISGREQSRLTTVSIGNIIASIAESAGLDHLTAHMLRHTFGTSLVRDGVDLVTVAQLMGHARLETTRAYTQPSQADLERALSALPVDE
jgi:site-specific recombinase XerD